MQSHDEIAVPVSLEEFTIYVAIELSGKSWVIGVKPPGSGRERIIYDIELNSSYDRSLAEVRCSTIPC